MVDTGPFTADDKRRAYSDEYPRSSDSGKLSKSYAYLWDAFVLWCRDRHETAIPARPLTVLDYLEERFNHGAKPSTLRVIAAAIARRHSDENLENPCADEIVRDFLEYSFDMQREPAPPRVLPLDMECYLAIRKSVHAPRSSRGGWTEHSHTARTRGMRDVAMIGLMRDARLKVREATQLTWNDLSKGEDGLWRVSVRSLYRSGEIETRVISNDTAALLDETRRYAGGNKILGLSPNQIGARIRDAAVQAGLGPGYSGESPRMGMLRDLETLGLELLGEYIAQRTP